MNYLTHRPIDTTLPQKITSGRSGAAVTFWGIVRAAPEDGPVTAIEYSAAETLAEKMIGAIIQEAKARWPLEEVWIQHRLGRVNVGEASIGIAIFSGHREEAYAASRFVIDSIKMRVPIWKKEIFEGGETRWMPGHPLEEAGSHETWPVRTK